MQNIFYECSFKLIFIYLKTYLLCKKTMQKYSFLYKQITLNYATNSHTLIDYFINYACVSVG